MRRGLQRSGRSFRSANAEWEGERKNTLPLEARDYASRGPTPRTPVQVLRLLRPERDSQTEGGNQSAGDVDSRHQGGKELN